MNVEGDFRYVDSGAFDECSAFLDHWVECEHNWEEAFISWIRVSERLKEDRKMSKSHWGPLNLVKVSSISFEQYEVCLRSLCGNIIMEVKNRRGF